ncbi:hypothetical protein BASA61_003258 [Batrachochytrium salamandrivorans]|nr:hypothetical protein BASA61_003258 [Batrachochytrium salamandrivorans]
MVLATRRSTCAVAELTNKPSQELSSILPASEPLVQYERRKTFPLRQHSIRRPTLPPPWAKLHSIVDKLASTRTLLNTSRLTFENDPGEVAGRPQPTEFDGYSIDISAGVNLPIAVTTCIFSFLTPSALSVCGAVNSSWRQAAMDPKHWQLHCLFSGVFDSLSGDNMFVDKTDYASEGMRWKVIYYSHQMRCKNWLTGKYTKQVIDVLDATDAITCVALDHSRLIVGSRERKLQLSQIDTPDFWRMSPQKPIPQIIFEGCHQSPIMCIGHSLNVQNIIVSADTSGELAFWNSFTGKALASIKHANKGGVSSICIVDNEHIVCAGFDKLIRLYRLTSLESSSEKGAPSNVRPSVHTTDTTSQPMSLNDKQPSMVEANSSVNLKQPTSEMDLKISFSGLRSWRRSSTIHPKPEINSRLLDTDALKQSGSKKQRNESSLFGWRKKPPTSSTKRTITLVHEMKGHKGDIYCLELLNGRSRLASGSSDNTIKIWNTRGGNCIMTLKGHQQAVTCLKASHPYLFSSSLDRSIRKWDLVNGSCTQVILGHLEWIKTIEIIGDYLVSGGWDESIFVWELKTGALLYKIGLDMGPILSLHCSPSRIVAAVRDPRFQHVLVSIDFVTACPHIVKSQPFRKDVPTLTLHPRSLSSSRSVSKPSVTSPVPPLKVTKAQLYTLAHAQ